MSYSYSQEYYSIKDSIYNDKDFKLFLKSLEKTKVDKKKDYQLIFIPTKLRYSNDSIIKYGSISYVPKFLKFDKWFENLSKSLPKFELEKFNGGSLNSDSLKGKPTVINFWFTKCPPCIAEIPNLNLLKQIHKDKINTIALTFDDRATVIEFAKKYDFDFEILINSQKFIDEMGIYGFPKTILLDKNNIIRYIPQGIYSPEVKSNKYLLNQINIY